MALRYVASIICAAACAACGSGADVVAVGSLEAESSQDGGLGSLPDIPADDCKAGDYVGLFRGTIGGAYNIQIHGTIHFRLDPVLSGEFLEVTQSDLSGETEDGTPLSADVQGGSGHGCREGSFNAALENGKFGAFEFEGVVTGTYDGTQSTFLGEWRTFPRGDSENEIGSGVWAAIHLPDGGI